MSRTRRERAARNRRLAKYSREGHLLGFVVVGRVTARWAPAGTPPSAFMDRPMFFDRQGEPLTVAEYAVLHSFRSYHRVAESHIAGLWISTVWLGTDYSMWDDDGPIIFETMIFADDPLEELHPELREWVKACRRYGTEEQAEAGHAQACVEIRVLAAKITMAQEIHDQALGLVPGWTEERK